MRWPEFLLQVVQWDEDIYSQGTVPVRANTGKIRPPQRLRTGMIPYEAMDRGPDYPRIYPKIEDSFHLDGVDFRCVDIDVGTRSFMVCQESRWAPFLLIRRKLSNKASVTYYKLLWWFSDKGFFVVPEGCRIRPSVHFRLLVWYRNLTQKMQSEE